ncbi:hypothetical protein [Halobacterium litoreum]|uniref:Tat (Twin-arginine translocation) pathway signal sequence n=1 Tax=Halobacterium litoreum TaxID=2039234 RepID=A0ABD5NBY2_9EURY|nr:hypothetical protein [Halobacterium litoreum]UHH14430.1 hypothetical protein LT972_05385 [Halobacterium litoreum]
MPSRRQFLAAAGTTGVAACAGCASTFDEQHAAFVHAKSVRVRWQAASGERATRVLRVNHDAANGRVHGYYDPALVAAAVEPPTGVVVDDATHDRLTGEFDAVEYELGVCDGSPGDVGECFEETAGREDFNSAPLTGRCAVVEAGDELDVVGAESGVYDVKRVELDERAWDAHRDN